MRHSAPPVRIMALASANEPRRARGELYRSFALLMAAVATLVALVAFLVLHPRGAVTASNVVAGRWLLIALGALTALLAFVAARPFLQLSVSLPARRFRIGH